MQISTLESALEIQERALSSNGYEAAKHISSLNLPSQSQGQGQPQPPQQSQQQQSQQHASPTPTYEPTVSFDSIHPNDIKSFPYLKLLQLWRKQALRVTYEKLLVESEYNTTIQHYKHIQQSLEQRLIESESLSLSLKERHKSYILKTEALDQQLSYLQHSLELETDRRLALEKQCEDSSMNLTQLRQVAERFRYEVDHGQGLDSYVAAAKVCIYDMSI